MKRKGLKLKVAERDNWICQICCKPVDPLAVGEERASCDHIIPYACGGTAKLSNLRLTHQSCNNRRHNLSPNIDQCDH